LPRFTGSATHYGIEQTGEGASRGLCAGVRALPARPGASPSCLVSAWSAPERRGLPPVLGYPDRRLLSPARQPTCRLQ